MLHFCKQFRKKFLHTGPVLDDAGRHPTQIHPGCDLEGILTEVSAGRSGITFSVPRKMMRRAESAAFSIIVDPTARTLRWCSPPPDAQRAAKLRHRPAILSMIDALTDREFEALACVALRLVGATETALTPRGNEGGKAALVHCGRSAHGPH